MLVYMCRRHSHLASNQSKAHHCAAARARLLRQTAAGARLSDAHLTLADDMFVVMFGNCHDLIQG